MSIEKNVQQGTVKVMSKDGKRFLLEETDQWYSVFYESNMPENVGKGAVVSFSYKAVQRGERVYNNIQGKVGLISAGSPGNPEPKVVAGNFASGGPSKKDLSITRQVAAKMLFPAILERSLSADPKLELPVAEDIQTAIALTMELGEDFARWMAMDPDFTGPNAAAQAAPVIPPEEDQWSEPNVLDSEAS